MNNIRALIATGVAFVVLAVSGYFVYGNSDFLFGEPSKPEVVVPAPEVVEVTEAASAAASSAVPASAAAPAPVSVAPTAKAAATPASAPAPRLRRL